MNFILASSSSTLYNYAMAMYSLFMCYLSFSDTNTFVLGFFSIRIGSDELMGVVTLGPRMSGQGREHWFEMLESPRKPVAQWYSLLEHSPLPVNGNGNGKCCLRQRQSTEDSTQSDGLP